MELIISKNANSNYLSKIVEIQSFHPHPDPDVSKLKCCTVDGYNIIVGIDEQPGRFVYFPALSQINNNLLSYCNLYKHKELNSNPNETGMFEDNGRVKAIRLRGCISEGFLLPIIAFQNFILSVTNKEIACKVGTEFDSIKDGNKEFWISKKYIVVKNLSNNISKESKYQKNVKKFNRVIDTQFRFHYDTTIIKKVPNAILPDDIIQISSKIHGTSGISACVLCKQPLSIRQRIAKWLTGEEFNKYDYLYSSRTVIKNATINEGVTSGYYGCDVWAEADKIIKPCLQKGMHMYYEIVGFLPNGGYIQKGYDYGCESPKEGEKYTHEKHFKVRVYRITLTNVDGQVHEFSTQEVQQYCKKVGLVPVTELYYGPAKDLYPDLDVTIHFNENFIERLSNDKSFYMECDSPECVNKVPHEGVVIKKDNMESSAFKLKCFNFLNKTEQASLDKGESNIEDEN